MGRTRKRNCACFINPLPCPAALVKPSMPAILIKSCWMFCEKRPIVLGVHQRRERFFLYRIYLKARFGTWPAALRAAGMRRLPVPDLTIPDWEQMLLERPDICNALEDVTQRRCRLGYPPRKRDVPQAKIHCERFRSWENVIAAAEAFQTWQMERGNSV